MDNQHIQQHIQEMREAIKQRFFPKFEKIEFLLDTMEQQQREIERQSALVEVLRQDNNLLESVISENDRELSSLRGVLEQFVLESVSPKEDQTPPNLLYKYRVAFAIHGYDGIRNVVTKSSREVVAENEESAEESVIEEERKLHKYESVVSLGVTLLGEVSTDVQDDTEGV